MANDTGNVATPNEVYSFFKKRVCKLCGAALKADDQSYLDKPLYFGAAECSLTHHYFIYVTWRDPKVTIMIDSEIFEFEFEDITYKLNLQYLSEHSSASIDGVEFGVRSSQFHYMKLSEESIAKRINTIRLLK